MKILGYRRYVEISGDTVHELPPLLLKEESKASQLDAAVATAEQIVASDDLLSDAMFNRANPEIAVERNKMGLAVNLAEQYSKFLTHWCWGESILEWIRQCETTFEHQPALRPLLRADLWPHAGRSSFVTLLTDKQVASGEVVLENAVGFRLTFRQPPPIDFFSDLFLFLLNNSLAGKAYETWSSVSALRSASLPPERFQFFVMADEIRQV